MPSVPLPNLDYLVARLHGRRGQFAEADKLDALCRLRNVADFVRAVSPRTRFTTVVDFQHGLINEMVQELADLGAQLTGAGAALMAWMRVRCQIENLKVMARAFATGKSFDVARPYLVPLPDDLSLDLEVLAAADDVESFAMAAPAGLLRDGLVAFAPAYEVEPSTVVLEAALDHTYFRELLKRTQALRGAARNDALIIAKQEIDTFHLMLVARGCFHYGVRGDSLEMFHVSGGRISLDRFRQMADADRLSDAVALVSGLVLDTWSGVGGRYASGTAECNTAMLESLAWNRYYRLARQAFRRNHMGLGAVVAFAAIRRIEVANLITLSEGIRTHMPADAIRKRLIPRNTEAIHV